MNVKLITSSVIICFILVTEAQARKFQVFTKEDYDDVYDEEEASPEFQTNGRISSTTSFGILPLQEELTNEERGNPTATKVHTFVINLPMNNTGGQRTIEIKIPMELMNKNRSTETLENTVHPDSKLASLSTDDQRVKNIEAALMQVLTTELKASTESPGKENVRPLATTPKSFIDTRPLGPLAPVADMILSEIQRGQLPQLLVRSIKYLEKNAASFDVAIDIVECVIFFYCDPNSSVSARRK